MRSEIVLLGTPLRFQILVKTNAQPADSPLRSARARPMPSFGCSRHVANRPRSCRLLFHRLKDYMTQAFNTTRAHPGLLGLIPVFALAGAASGLLSSLMGELPGAHPFEVSNIYPGVVFGLTLCAVFHRKLGTPVIRLIAAFALVQLAWHAAIQIAAFAETSIKDVPPGLAALPAIEGIKWNYVVPGLIAGAVGGLGTWVAGAVCHDALRTPKACLVTTLTGAILGTLLAIENYFFLFIPGQGAVAASLGAAIARFARTN